jgi:hypothetical protein
MVTRDHRASSQSEPQHQADGPLSLGLWGPIGGGLGGPMSESLPIQSTLESSAILKAGFTRKNALRAGLQSKRGRSVEKWSFSEGIPTVKPLFVSSPGEPTGGV